MIWIALLVVLVAGMALLAWRAMDVRWPPTGRAVIDRVARGLVGLAAVAIAALAYSTIASVQQLLAESPGVLDGFDAGKECARAVALFVVEVARSAGPLVALAAILDHLARRLPPRSDAA